MSQAISGLMKSSFSNLPDKTRTNTFKKTIRPAEARSREEQIGIDRQRARRGDDALARRGKTIISRRQLPLPRDPWDNRQNPWSRLEQALKVTDLILHTGGFGAVLMDLGDVPPLNARRIPLATWFRFRRAVDNTPTVFLLLTREPCAQTCASLVLRCQRCRERWSQAAESKGAARVITLDGLDLEVKVMRRQTQHSRAVNSASWQTRMHWSGT
jgi:recombination protein RecA